MSIQVTHSGLDLYQVPKPVGVHCFHAPLLILVTTFFPCVSDMLQAESGSVSPWWIWVGISSAFVLANFSFFVRRNIIGTPIYMWMNGNVLEVHKQDWWIERRGKAVPAGPVLKIWFGGWFRRDKILSADSPHWNVRMTWGFFSGRPKYLWLYDTEGEAISVRHFYSVEESPPFRCHWRSQPIADVLRAIGTLPGVCDVVYAATVPKSDEDVVAINVSQADAG